MIDVTYCSPQMVAEIARGLGAGAKYLLHEDDNAFFSMLDGQVIYFVNVRDGLEPQRVVVPTATLKFALERSQEQS